MNELEARRIVAVVRALRPQWSEGLVMTVLNDKNLCNRPFQDVVTVAVACYADPTTAKPGRIHQPGKWWLTVTAQAPDISYRTPQHDDCRICGRPVNRHPMRADHEYERVDGISVGPTAEQRAEIQRSIEAAAVAVSVKDEEAPIEETTA